jgi:hypothetical protein
MLDDKKSDVLEGLMAEWIGEVGQLNKAVQQLPPVVRKSLGEIESLVVQSTSKMASAVEILNGEGRLHTETLNRISKQTTETINGFISEFNQSSGRIRISLSEIRNATGRISDDATVLKEGIDGLVASSACLNLLNQESGGLIEKIKEAKEIVNQSSVKIDAAQSGMNEALNRMNKSTLGHHLASLVVIGGLLMLSAGFALGYLVKSVTT